MQVQAVVQSMREWTCEGDSRAARRASLQGKLRGSRQREETLGRADMCPPRSMHNHIYIMQQGKNRGRKKAGENACAGELMPRGLLVS